MLQIAVLCLSFALVAGNPDWSGKPYIAKGYIILPYGNIREPFQAWIDPKTMRSRIDYYGGMNSILFLNKAGYKIVPGNNAMICYNVTGGIGFQTVLPNLKSYKVVNKDTPCYYESKIQSCTLYRFTEKTMDKQNTYDMRIIGDSIPVLFNFTGYDALMGSHYDKYVFEYTEFKQTDIPGGIFAEIDKFKTCGDFPGPGVSRVILDPMSEFMGMEHSDEMEQDLNLEFEDFKQKYSKTYNTYNDHEGRKSNFRQVRRFVNSKNRENLGFKLAINHLADHTEEELKLRNGHIYSGIGESHRLRNDEVSLSEIYIPDSMNWTEKGAVNPPKDQGICGSCWSFGTTGTIEGSCFVKSGKLPDLSEQSLMDCTWDQGNNGCDGGETERVGEWLLEKYKNHSVVTRKTYAAAAKYPDAMRDYLMADGHCHWSEDMKPCVKILNYTVLPMGNIEALRNSNAYVGPIQVAIDASRPSFSFYSSGVYYDELCKNGPNDLDHSVLLVGYGSENGQDYWLVKNSWSTYWGDLGYIKMSTKNNNCGVATDAVFFTLAE